MILKLGLFLAVILAGAPMGHADTTDLCGKHNNAITHACTVACEAANEIRRSKGLPLMEADAAVCKAAKIQADYLNKKFGACGKKNKKDCLTHSGQGAVEGAALAKRLQMAEASYHCAGENLSFGAKSIASAFSRWMKSPVHHEHLVDSRFRRQGYAEVGPYKVHVLTD